MARCLLSEKHVRKISRIVGIKYFDITYRGGSDGTLLAWRDAMNADRITRDRKRQPILVVAAIREGAFVADEPTCWVKGQGDAATV